MFSTGRRRIAWLLASTLWVACGGAKAKVEAPRATEDEVDPDEFAISDEPDRELESDETPTEKPVEEKPADDEKVAEAEEAEEPEAEEPPPPPPKAKAKANATPTKAAAKKTKKAKKVVEAEPEEEEASAEDEEPARERVNRKTMALHKKRGDSFDVGVGRRDREARMARDERARAKGSRGSAREREEEAEEDREERAEEARQAKQEREEKARTAKEAKAEKLRAAKEAKAEKARKAKDAKAEKLRIAQEAKAEKARKAQDAKKAAAATKATEDEESDDEDESEEEEAPAPKKVAKGKAKVDENLIEMDGEEEEEERATSVASIEEDDPLAETPRIDRTDEEPEPTVVPALPSINDRGLTVAPKQLEIHGRLGLQTLTLPGATAGTTVSSTSETLALGVAYGIGTKAEVGADYTLSINPGTVKGPLALHVAYAAKHSRKLDVAIAAGLAFDFIDTPNAVTMMTTSTSYASLQLGAWARYRATPKVSIFTGLPALPSAAPSLSKNSLALPPFSYQVQIGLNNQGTTAIEIPIGLGVQIKPNIYAFASLDLAHIRLANTAPAYIFSDFIPFSLGAFYTHKKLDIGVQLSDDLEKGADYLQLGTVLRYLVK